MEWKVRREMGKIIRSDEKKMRMEGREWKMRIEGGNGSELGG